MQGIKALQDIIILRSYFHRVDNRFGFLPREVERHKVLDGLLAQGAVCSPWYHVTVSLNVRRYHPKDFLLSQAGFTGGGGDIGQLVRGYPATLLLLGVVGGNGRRGRGREGACGSGRGMSRLGGWR